MTSEETRAIIDICSDASVDDGPVQVWGPEEPDQVVAVEVADLALTVIPRVRRKLQEMRSQALLRHFQVYDYEQKGFISIETCHQLANELKIDTRIFDECFQAEEKSSDDEEEGKDQHRAPPTTIWFETFQSVVNGAREKATREDRQRERQIQTACALPEETFQEFREDLLVLHELFERFDSDGTETLDVMEVTFMLKDFGLLPDDQTERKNVFSILEQSDEDGSGEYEFHEFLGLVHQIRDYAMSRHKEELLAVFERYDRDGSGELSIAELSGLLMQIDLVPYTRREQ